MCLCHAGQTIWGLRLGGKLTGTVGFHQIRGLLERIEQGGLLRAAIRSTLGSDREANMGFGETRPPAAVNFRITDRRSGEYRPGSRSH